MNSFKKMACGLVFCAFLSIPQSTICLDINLGKNAKSLLICAGGVALASLVGCGIYRLLKPLSNKQEVDRAKIFVSRAKKFKEELSKTYHNYLYGPISPERLPSRGLYAFRSKISGDINSIQSFIKEIEQKEKHIEYRKKRLLKRKTSQPIFWREQYDALLDQILVEEKGLAELIPILEKLKDAVERHPRFQVEYLDVINGKVGCLEGRVSSLSGRVTYLSGRLSCLESKVNRIRR